MGLSGAAWAMTVGYVVSSTILIIAFWRVSGMGLMETWMPRRDDLRYLLGTIRSSLIGGRAS
jgi:Na+-driven multidrug efflux pump